jgi:hypothetical protein
MRRPKGETFPTHQHMGVDSQPYEYLDKGMDYFMKKYTKGTYVVDTMIHNSYCMIRIKGFHIKGVDSLLPNSQHLDSKLSRVNCSDTMIDLVRRLFTH